MTIKDIDWTLERQSHQIHPLPLCDVLRNAGLDASYHVDSDGTERTEWVAPIGVPMEAVQFVAGRRGELGHMQTAIRAVGAGLDGFWTYMSVSNEHVYRFPAGEDPNVTGIQLRLHADDTSTVWGHPRPPLTSEELSIIFSGDLSLFYA
jgi:hypothetical protein